MGLVLDVGGKNNDGFNYDYPIITNKTSTESNNVGSFIFTLKNIRQSGWNPDHYDKEIRSLLEQFKMRQQLIEN